MRLVSVINNKLSYTTYITHITENVPQIIISVAYAVLLVGFKTTVLFALVSSVLSVLLAVFSAVLEYPKHYYYYEMRLKLQNDGELKDNLIRRKIRYTFQMRLSVCTGLGQELDSCFIENVFYDSNVITFNVVSHRAIKYDAQILKSKLKDVKHAFLDSNVVKFDCNKVRFKEVGYACVQLKYCCCCEYDPNKSRLPNVQVDINTTVLGLQPIGKESALLSSMRSLGLDAPENLSNVIAHTFGRTENTNAPGAENETETVAIDEYETETKGGDAKGSNIKSKSKSKSKAKSNKRQKKDNKISTEIACVIIRNSKRISCFTGTSFQTIRSTTACCICPNVAIILPI